MAHTPTYNSWCHLRRRCDDPGHPKYKDYGGRGITYDPRWREFIHFLEDMGVAPPGTSIDREDNEGHYEKANCRWATQQINQNNRRDNVFVEYKGERITMANLARKVGVKPATLRKRIVDYGFTVDEAVIPTRSAWRKSARYEVAGHQLTLVQIEARCGVSRYLLARRIAKGMSIKDAIALPARPYISHSSPPNEPQQ